MLRCWLQFLLAGPACCYAHAWGVPCLSCTAFKRASSDHTSCCSLLAFAADEIDAIGKARSSGPTDSGTQEREQGLLQLLTEMDGFYQDDKVGAVCLVLYCCCTLHPLCN